MHRCISPLSSCVRIAASATVLAPPFSLPPQFLLTAHDLCTMSTDPLVEGSSLPPPQTPPLPRTFASPPLADNVVRPFTSQGSTFGSSGQPLTYVYAPQPNRPSSAHGSHSDLASAKYGPYMSASARTSYTRVDVDSLPSPAYPPLPPLPAAFQTAPVAVSDDADAVSQPAGTAPFPPVEGSTNGAQPHSGEETIPQTPQVSLTFLLVSGQRKTQTFEPETTVGRVKELVWNVWPARDGGLSSFPLRLRDDRPCLCSFSIPPLPTPL